MDDKQKKKGSPKYLFTILRWMLGGFLILFLLSLIIVLSLPLIISSNKVESKISSHISKILQRPVEIENIHWRWFSPFQIMHLSIQEGTEFTYDKLLTIEEIAFDLDYWDLFLKKIHFRMKVKGLNAIIERKKDGRTNVQKLLEEINRGKETPKDKKQEPKKTKKDQPDKNDKKAKKDIHLPFDVISDIRLENFNIKAIDHVTGKTLKIEDLGFHLNMPSISSKPISLYLSTKLNVDDQKILPADISFEIKDIFNAQRNLEIQNMGLKSKINIPGIQIDAKGEMASLGVEIDSYMDLLKIWDTYQPLIPAKLPISNIKGNLNIQLQAAGNKSNIFNTNITVQGKNISSEGEIFKNGPFGPMEFFFNNHAQFAINTGHISLKETQLKFQENSVVDLTAEVENVYELQKQNGTGIELDIKTNFDLEELWRSFRPILPDQISGTILNGVFSSDFHVSGNPKTTIFFDTNIFTGDMEFIGDDKSPIKNKTVGPIKFKMKNKGHINLDSENLTLETGELKLFDLSSIEWSGQVNAFKSEAPDLDFQLGPINLNFDELMTQFHPFIPDTLPVKLEKSDDPFYLFIDNIRLSGRLPNGPNILHLSQFNLKVPNVKYPLDNQNEVWIDKINFRINPVTIHLIEKFPEKIQLDASLGIGHLKVMGAPEIQVEDFNIPKLAVNISNIEKTDTETPLFSAHVNFDQFLTVKKVNALNFGSFENITQQLNLETELINSEDISITMKRLDFEIQNLHIEHEEIPAFNTQLKFNLNTSDIFINGLKKSIPDIDMEKLALNLNLKDFLDVRVEAGYIQKEKKEVHTLGDISLDFAPVMEILPKNIKDRFHLTGRADMFWDFDGFVPDAKEIKALKIGSDNLMGRINDIVNHVQLGMNLAVNDFNFNITDDEKLNIKSISLNPGIKYTFNSEQETGLLSGKIVLNKIDINENMKKYLKESLDLELGYSIKHEGMNGFTLNETLSLAPLEINQNLEVSLSGINRLGKTVLTPSLLWMDKLDAEATFNLTLNDLFTLSNLHDSIYLNGDLATTAIVSLVPGDRIEAKLDTDIPLLDLTLDDKIKLNALKTHLEFSKKVFMDRAMPSTQQDSLDVATEKPLSVAVLNPSFEKKSGFILKNTSVERYLDEVEKRLKKDHTITLQTLELKQGDLPILIEGLKADIDLNGKLPGIQYFQMDILGGTILGGLSLLEDKGSYYFRTHLIFTGIDSSKFFPDEASVSFSKENEINGNVLIFVPLTSIRHQLIQNMQFNLEFSHIGSRALERLLYALDPYESNETIVAQRKLLRTGSPRWVKVNVKDGALSLNGELNAKGLTIGLPSIKRLNITDLPGLDVLDENLKSIDNIVELLNIYTSDSMRIDASGKKAVFYKRENGNN